MNPTRLLAAAVFVVIGVATSTGFQTPRSWPPDVQSVSADSPVLTPAEELKTIYMPPGYHLELVASEPLATVRGSSTLGHPASRFGFC